jgi:hypothetical protein
LAPHGIAGTRIWLPAFSQTKALITRRSDLTTSAKATREYPSRGTGFFRPVSRWQIRKFESGRRRRRRYFRMGLRNNGLRWSEGGPSQVVDSTVESARDGKAPAPDRALSCIVIRCGQPAAISCGSLATRSQPSTHFARCGISAAKLAVILAGESPVNTVRNAGTETAYVIHFLTDLKFVAAHECSLSSRMGRAAWLHGIVPRRAAGEAEPPVCERTGSPRPDGRSSGI